MSHSGEGKQGGTGRHNGARPSRARIQAVLALAGAWQRIPDGLAEELTGLPRETVLEGLRAAGQDGGTR